MTRYKVRNVAKNAFGGLKALENLIMNGNDMRYIPNIKNVKSTLKCLHLQGNKISKISDNYFMGFKQLSYLNLDYNRLLVLPTMSWLERTLSHASFDNNHLISLDGLTLGGYYTQLRSLYIRYNNITYFNSISFLAMPSLIIISLTGNKLVYIADFRPYYNGIIHLNENLWVCDQSLSWMRDIYFQFPVVCSSPSCLSGRDIKSLGELLTMCPLT